MRPNVVLLTIDTLRADALGRRRGAAALTPYLDTLARDGLRFSQAVTCGSWTQAAFPPLLTSTYASMHGGCLGPLSPDRPSPVEAFQQAGYHTAAFSTSPLLSRAYGYHRGFSEFTDLEPGERDPWLRRVRGGQRLLRSDGFQRLMSRLAFDLQPARLYADAAELVERAGEWLAAAEKPFFLWLHAMDVHWPYHLSQDLRDPGAVAQAWRDLANLHASNWNGRAVSVEEKAHYIELYERALAYVDEQVVRLISSLMQTGCFDNTVLVVVSDHGEEFLEHGRWGHWENNLYDEILRVPLFFYAPGRLPSGQVEAQVRTLDLMPTLLDLCAVPAPEGMDGLSLRSLWEREGRPPSAEVAIAEMWREGWHRVAVRTETHKYIWDSQAPENPELYDLQRDPAERENLADREVVLRQVMERQVQAHLERLAGQSSVPALAEPALSQQVVDRLRGLGYLE